LNPLTPAFPANSPFPELGSKNFPARNPTLNQKTTQTASHAETPSEEGGPLFTSKAHSKMDAEKS